jgi:hypothetical protein
VVEARRSVSLAFTNAARAEARPSLAISRAAPAELKKRPRIVITSGCLFFIFWLTDKSCEKRISRIIGDPNSGRGESAERLIFSFKRWGCPIG